MRNSTFFREMMHVGARCWFDEVCEGCRFARKQLLTALLSVSSIPNALSAFPSFLLSDVVFFFFFSIHVHVHVEF